jgi:hypothetical protein
MTPLPMVSSLSLGPFEYRSATQIADIRREHEILTVAEARAEQDSRLPFATAYKNSLRKGKKR